MYVLYEKLTLLPDWKIPLLKLDEGWRIVLYFHASCPFSIFISCDLKFSDLEWPVWKMKSEEIMILHEKRFTQDYFSSIETQKVISYKKIQNILLYWRQSQKLIQCTQFLLERYKCFITIWIDVSTSWKISLSFHIKIRVEISY